MTLAEFIRNMLQKWFHDRHAAARSMRHRLTDAAHLVILKRVEKCGFMTVNPVDWNIFSVRHKGKQWTVDLARKTCTCNKFQMDFFPCSHALAAARERNLDFTSLCADYYKRETLIDAYSVPIMPVGHPSSWVVPSDIAARVVLNPKTKRQSGGVPTRLWLMKVPVELSPRNIVASAASVIQLDTTNKRALIRKAIKHNKAVQDEDELPPEAP
ncbi:hypothetical protein QYF36_009447 [Acer negundo]|nr:hypothetical protein QYF36_009447 [Acer negundo]